MDKTYICILYLTCQVFMVACRTDYIRLDGFNGLCIYKGYKPGGNVINIEPITAPTAQLQGSSLANLAGNTGRAATLGMHAQNAVNAFTKAEGAFKKIFTTFASIAPKLGPCLGVFGAALGFVDAFTKPTPGDILAATNKAIGKLTEEVNNRLDQMKGYVDQKVITLEKDLIEREYKTMFNLWSGCIKEATLDLANECQRDSYKYVSASEPKFALYSGYMDSWSKNPPTKDQVKRIEASLISFRDYVQLMLMALKALEGVYETDKSSTGQHYYNLYKTELQTKSKFYIKFATIAVRQILKMHAGSNSRGEMDKTFKCTGKNEIHEGGLITAHTADSTDCSAILEPAGTERCKMSQTRRADGKTPNGYYEIPSKATSDYGAMQAYARYQISEKAWRFVSKSREVIATYWDNELLNLMPIWNLYTGTSKREIREVPEQAKRSLDGFSARFQERLRKAIEAASRG